MLLLLLLALGQAPAPAAPVDAGPPPDPLAAPRALFEKRLDPVSLDQAIAQLDFLTGPEARLLGARAHRFRAQAFELRHRPLKREQGIADLEAARTRALEAWDGLQPGASVKFLLGDASSLAAAGPESLPALAELAQADLALAGWRKPVPASALLKEALAVATRGEALSPDFDDAVFRRVRGSALAALPPLAGGDLEAARFELERAIAAAPLDLAPRVELAARYAVKAQDRALFHAALEAALHLDVEALPDRIPEQRLARARALGLLRHERQLFRG
ncbi:MAG: hypothetical protein JST54_22255 [Deltaproteobacteria bacterium]|nr:hypothetical protein [Deltaproteobacteria bacterium]